MTLIEFLRLSPEEKTRNIWISGIEGEGEYIRCLDNGQIYEHCFYENGKRHGEYKAWNYNGKLYIHSLYENGIKVKDYLK